jgi:hypothetical protein
MCLAEELRKNKSLNVQGDFGTIIEVGRIELCFLGVYPVRDPKEKSLTGCKWEMSDKDLEE